MRLESQYNSDVPYLSQFHDPHKRNWVALICHTPLQAWQLLPRALIKCKLIAITSTDDQIRSVLSFKQRAVNLQTSLHCKYSTQPGRVHQPETCHVAYKQKWPFWGWRAYPWSALAKDQAQCLGLRLRNNGWRCDFPTPLFMCFPTP